MHALIVEDEASLQNFYNRVLQRHNVDVYIAMDGEQAIAHLQSNTPDLILLDMRLPYIKGSSILDFIADNERLYTTHVVIASAGQEYEQEVNKVPSAEFLLKPILPAQIDEIVRRLMNGSEH